MFKTIPVQHGRFFRLPAYNAICDKKGRISGKTHCLRFAVRFAKDNKGDPANI